MAIINCPECKKEISSQAHNCPHCGFPIARNPESKIIVQKREGCFLQTLNLGCLLTLAFVALMIISMLFFSSNLKKHQDKIKNGDKNIIDNNSKGRSR